jgi:hypothetical protein
MKSFSFFGIASKSQYGAESSAKPALANGVA